MQISGIPQNLRISTLFLNDGAITASGAITITAGGTNQNITLMPSGTGRVVLSGTGTSTVPALALTVAGNASYTWASQALAASLANGNAVVHFIGRAGSTNESGYFGFIPAGSGTTTNGLTWGLYNNDRLMTLLGTGNLLIGTTTDSSNGKLQLATHTTSAGGIGFGTDVSLFRSAVGTLSLSGMLNVSNAGSSTIANFTNSANSDFQIVLTSSTSATIGPSTATSLILKSANTTALTLNSSQNATFAGTITTSAPTGGAGAWELGIANAVSPTAPNRTITVEIGGTAYYIHAKTTND